MKMPARKPLVGEVVQDEAMRAPQASDETRGICPVTDRQAGQLKPGDPALGLVGQAGNIELG
jgi:hypothetical protein